MVLQTNATFVWNSPAHFVFRPQEVCGSVYWKKCSRSRWKQRTMSVPTEGRAAFVQERRCTEGQLAVSGDLLQLQGCPAREADMMLGDIRGPQQAPFSRVMFHFGRCLQYAGPSLVSKQPNADLCMALTGSECCKKELTAKHTHPPTFRLCGQNPALTPSTRVSHPLAGT